MDELSWTSRLDSAETAQVQTVLAAATAADGVAPASENVLLHLRAGADQERPTHLLARTRGELTGYAHLEVSVHGAEDEPDTELVAELTVAPDQRRRGLGAGIVRQLVDHARVEHPGTPLRVWAHGEHPGAVRLAERFGFRRTRELLQMRRCLDASLPEPQLPEGLRLRTFRPGDEAAVVAVNNRAFAWHPEQGGWDIEQLRARQAEPWFDQDGFFLAVDQQDRLHGFHWTKVHPARLGEPSLGEVYVVGVDPDAQGGGLGATLTVAGLQHLRAAGLGQVMLYVEADNEPAVRVYTQLGFQRWDVDVMFTR